MAIIGSVSGPYGIHMTLPKDFRKITARLQKEIVKIKGATDRGLVNAALYIRTQTEKVPYATPLHYGNLRASWFIVATNGSEVRDPEHYSKKFKNNPEKKMTAGEFRAQHTDTVEECATLVKVGKKIMGKRSIIFGYSANYALWVHEMIRATFRERQPQAGPRWFMSAIERNKGKMSKIIAETSKIPK